MCMTTVESFWNQFPRYALSDITVYKVLRKVGMNPDDIYAPHRKGFKYTLGKMYLANITKDSKGNIEEGLHSFTTIEDAKDEAKRLTDRESGKYVIYKCTIPAGSKYYTGHWEYYYPAQKIPNIVSEALTIVEQVAATTNKEIKPITSNEVLLDLISKVNTKPAIPELEQQAKSFLDVVPTKETVNVNG